MTTNARKATHLLTGLALALLVTLAVTRTEATEPAPRPGVVNINTATIAEYMLLPGVGPRLASALNDYAETGPSACDHRCQFKTVDDLLKVKGIGPRKLELMRPYVTIDGPTTLKAKVKSPARARKSASAAGTKADKIAKGGDK